MYFMLAHQNSFTTLFSSPVTVYTVHCTVLYMTESRHKRVGRGECYTGVLHVRYHTRIDIAVPHRDYKTTLVCSLFSLFKNHSFMLHIGSKKKFRFCFLTACYSSKLILTRYLHYCTCMATVSGQL